MFELGCVSVPREDGTYFSTIYNNELPRGSAYAAIVVNSKDENICKNLSTYVCNVLNGLSEL